MSENTAPKKVEATKAPSKDVKKAKGDVVSARDSGAKVLKAKWTLERCQRYARRYPNEVTWSSAASASYKAAVAHGWTAECVAQMGHKHNNVVKKAA